MFIELWATDPAKLEYLKSIHGLVCPVVTMTNPYNSHEKRLVVRWGTLKKVGGGLPRIRACQYIPAFWEVRRGTRFRDWDLYGVGVQHRDGPHHRHCAKGTIQGMGVV